MTRTLSIDIETYSETDLRTSGVYKYAADPSFEVLLFAYAWDDGPVQVVDLASGEQLPDDIQAALFDKNITKTAWNAQFERVCLGAMFRKGPLPAEQWQCSMVHSYYLGLPGALAMAAKALKVDEQKDAAGTRLINYFSKPCKPTKVNGGRTRNLPEHDPEAWEQYRQYCIQDVRTEQAIRNRLLRIPLPPSEQEMWVIDQETNDRGFLVDPVLVRHAVRCDEQHTDKLMEQAKTLTGLDNPNSTQQLTGWLSEQEGQEITSVAKGSVEKLLASTNNPDVRQALELRQEMSRSSVAKYQSMKNTAGSDNRVRGLVQFYGASRTGRWAGRLVQVQNLPRNRMPDLDLARSLLKFGDYEAIELLWDSTSDVLSQLIRTAFVAAPGHRLIISDFSAIEARVLAWLAGEQWRLDVFNDHGKIYEASASQMFEVPLDQIDSELRDKGKVAELALGYQGGPNALKQMGALDQGLTEEELPGLVRTWRDANPAIAGFWRAMNRNAMQVIRDGGQARVGPFIRITREHGMLRIRLPSGRHLHYVRPRIDIDPKFDREGISFEDRGRRTRTYGGKLTENVTQAVARDCLAEALRRLHPQFRIVAHIHDEVVLEVPEGVSSPAEVADIMRHPIKWAPGLPLDADAFETYYYKKD